MRKPEVYSTDGAAHFLRTNMTRLYFSISTFLNLPSSLLSALSYQPWTSVQKSIVKVDGAWTFYLSLTFLFTHPMKDVASLSIPEVMPDAL